jgi:hypothetical protein
VDTGEVAVEEEIVSIMGTTTAGEGAGAVDKGAVEDFFCTFRGTTAGIFVLDGSGSWTVGGVGMGRDSPRDGLCGGIGVLFDGADLESDATKGVDVPLVRRS